MRGLFLVVVVTLVCAAPAGRLPVADQARISADPASVRPRLAEAAAASVDDIRRVLVETATGANKEMWATISCKHCGRAGRYEVTVPDNKVRLDASGAAP